MSRASLENSDTSNNEAYVDEVSSLNTMLALGRSFSGRERNCCFLNTGRGRFANISTVSGLDFLDDSRAVVAVDWDLDGDLDLWVSNRTGPMLRFLRNEITTQNNFISFRLEGNGTTTNRDAIGARIELTIDGESRTLIGTLRAGEGFLSQSSKWVYFGLGDNRQVDKAMVRWPGGKTEVFTKLNANTWYKVKQGSGVAQAWSPPQRRTRIVPGEVVKPSPSSFTRTILPVPFPIPRLDFVDLDGQQHSVGRIVGRPVLINLWASWCQPCLQELGDFATRAREIRSAGVDIVAVNIDQMGDSRSATTAELKGILQKLDFPFTRAVANPQLLKRIWHVQDLALGYHLELSVPISFLLNASGELVAIYRGRVEVDQLLDDMELLNADPIQRRDAATPLKGRWSAAPRTLDLTELAQNYYVAGYMADVEAIYRRVLRDDDKNSRIHYVLGGVIHQQGRLDEAIKCYQRALEIDPNLSEARDNLQRALIGAPLK